MSSSGVNFVIERGDRIALVGVNGAGKSTLIKLLAGAEPLTAGEYTLGHNVKPDYFAQDQYKELDPDARMLDDLSERGAAQHANGAAQPARLFSVHRGRCVQADRRALGRRAQSLRAGAHAAAPSNFLLLDEPTNHLDMRAKDVLLEALRNYTGTVVFVSHDRYFIDKLATRVFEIGDGEVRVFPAITKITCGGSKAVRSKLPTLTDILGGVPAAEPVPIRTTAALLRFRRSV